jgi:hypothetical protein
MVKIDTYLPSTAAQPLGPPIGLLTAMSVFYRLLGCISIIP